MKPQGRLDETPIGIDQGVVILDPLTCEPLPVEFVDPHALEVNPEHPRDRINGADHRYRAGRDEMSARGVRVPLVALTDRFLLDGHRRLATALELGIESVPVVFLTAAQARATFGTYTRAQRREMLLRNSYFRTTLRRIEELAQKELQ